MAQLNFKASATGSSQAAQHKQAAKEALSSVFGECMYATIRYNGSNHWQDASVSSASLIATVLCVDSFLVLGLLTETFLVHIQVSSASRAGRRKLCWEFFQVGNMQKNCIGWRGASP